MRLYELRKENELTLEQVAKILNTSRQNYERYEKEKVKVKIEDLKTLADYYNVSLDYLCERPFNNQIGYIPEDRRELVKMIIDLDASDIRAVTSYINGYLAGKSGNSNFKVFN